MVSLAKDEGFALNAYSSFSPDKLTGLRYVWTCERYDKIGDADLGFIRLNCQDFVLNGLQVANTQVLTIASQKLREQIREFSNAKKTGRPTYTQGCANNGPSATIRCDPTSMFYFSVTVCNPGSQAPCLKDAPMTSTATVSWSTTPRDPGLTASIAPIGNSRISAVFDVAVLGTSNVKSGVSYRWVQMNSDYDLLQPASVLTSVISNTLVVKAGVLVGAQTFTLRLYASLQGSLQDLSRVELHECIVCNWAQVKMLSNLAPSSGQFIVTPTTGSAMQTIYKFSAQEWVDPKLPQEDYPLSYTFGYKDADGAVKYLSVDSLHSSHQSDLPLGNIMCNDEEGDACRMLELVLEVADALDARGVADGLLVRVDRPMGDGIAVLFDLRRQTLEQLYRSQDGPAMLTSVLSAAEFLNDATVSFDQFGLNNQWKSATRNDLVESLQTAVDDLLQPMTLSVCSHVLSTLSAICTDSEEIEESAAGTASSILGTIGNEVLRRQRLGQGVDRMPQIMYYLDSIVAKVSAASSEASGRRYLSYNTSQVPKHAHLWGGPYKGRRADRRANRGPTSVSMQGMNVIKNVELSSQLGVCTHQASQQFAVAEGTSFKSITRRIEVSDIARQYSIVINARSIYELGTSPAINPNEPGDLIATIDLPDPGLITSAYEVQTTIMYRNPLPEWQTDISCINPQVSSIWDSPYILFPTDNYGSLVNKTLRPGIIKHAPRLCTLIGQAYVFEVRSFGQDVKIVNFGNGQRAKIRLPFNPQLNPSVLPTDLFADEFTGAGSAASCVYWDSKAHVWSLEGVEFIQAYYGDEKGLGAYVDCWTSHLSVFAVSEVALDCDGVPIGGKIKDWCGVCGGDNSTCSGCDGFPLSGRTKECNGHGACGGLTPVETDKCGCKQHYLGINCQIYCTPLLNCSGHGECYAHYDGLSMNTSVGCNCAAGWLETREMGYLECAWIPVYQYAMPWVLFYFLVAGVPILSLICCMACLCYWMTARQIAISKKMQGDIEGFVGDYEHENEEFAIDKTEINADLCMPIIGHRVDDDQVDGYGSEQTLELHGLDAPLQVNDTEQNTTRRRVAMRSKTLLLLASGADEDHQDPPPFLRIMPSDLQETADDDDEEDWRKYLVNTALMKRLKAVNDAKISGGPRHQTPDDGQGGDEVAV